MAWEPDRRFNVFGTHDHQCAVTYIAETLLNVTWKLVRTCLNYRVLGTSTAAIFLSNDHSLYAPLFLEWSSCLISFSWDQSTCQERVESNKIQNEKFLPTVFLEPTTLGCEVGWSTDWASRACWKLYLNDLITYMYSQYECIHCYRYEKDEGEHILSCKNKTNHPISSNRHTSATANEAIRSLKIGGGGGYKTNGSCFVLHYAIYIYIVQIAKRHTSPVFAFNMQTRLKILPDLAFWKQRTYVYICYLNFGFFCRWRGFSHRTDLNIFLFLVQLVHEFSLPLLGSYTCP